MDFCLRSNKLRPKTTAVMAVFYEWDLIPFLHGLKNAVGIPALCGFLNVTLVLEMAGVGNRQCDFQ